VGRWDWSEADLAECLDHIYRIAMDDEAIDDLVSHIAERWPGVRTAVFFQDVSEIGSEINHAESLIGFAGNWENLDAYMDYYVAINPWQPSVRYDVPIDQVMRSDRDLITTQEFRQTEFFNDYVRHQNVDFAIPVHFAKGNYSLSTIGLHIKENWLASDGDLQSLMRLNAALSPHLRRAFTLKAKVASGAASSSAFQQYLDDALEAVFIVRSNCVVVTQNAEAERMLGRNGVLKLDRFGALRLQNIDADRKMWDRIRSSGRIGSLNNARFDERLIHVAGELENYVVEVTPLEGFKSNRMFIEFTAPSAIVSVRSTIQEFHVDPKDLEVAFGLTPAEARLGSSVALGADATQYATILFVSLDDLHAGKIINTCPENNLKRPLL